jgi:hypothetical protein
MKRAKLLLALAVGILLVAPAHAGKPIEELPVNFDGSVYYDYRDYGNSNLATPGGPQALSGAYFHFDTFVWLDGKLTDYDNVVNVTAEHEESGQELSLLRGPVLTRPPPIDPSEVQGWYLFVKPEDWMFSGTWKLTMTYEVDGVRYRQSIWPPLGTVAFPVRPSHVTVTRSLEEFIVSWTATGNPYIGPLDYRVRIFEGPDIIADLRGKWDGPSLPLGLPQGTYDQSGNRIVFPIPCAYGGESYLIRLENRIYGSKACYFMVLPPCGPIGP